MRALEAWVVDDDASIRWVLERTLDNASIAVRCFPGGAELLDAIETGAPDVLLTDIRMPGNSGLDLPERVRSLRPALPIIIMTAHSDLDSAVAAYRGGAFEYLPKPFDLDDAVELVTRATRAGCQTPHRATQAGDSAAALTGQAPAMQALFRAIGRLSASDITVLITGESGTGKERVAHALHDNSPRRGAAFIAVNAAAIPKDLMESEFFGHEKGAFTGAVAQRLGRFEQADGGTLFLDEIGDMPADLQTRLLRVLQEGCFYRIGGQAPVNVDARVIAATNQDLERQVARRRFRQDLFYRLNVIRLRVPPLRERREDIPGLLARSLTRAAGELRVPAKTLAGASERMLCALDWPGNVRELENLCRWLTVMSPGQEIVPDDLPQHLRARSPADGAQRPHLEPALEHGAAPKREPAGGQSWDAQLADWARCRLGEGGDRLLDEALPDFERAMLRAALERSQGRRQEAARLLGWGRNTLTRKIKELGLTDDIA